MSLNAAIILSLIIVILIYGIAVYNSLVQLKHTVAKAWANIDVLLKQRHDELPKLIEVCRQYQQFEKATLERVIAARSQVASASLEHDVTQLGAAETALRSSLGQLFAVAEAYPELRSNEHFKQLQNRIVQLENNIADRRELYNEAVNLHNTRIEQFPDFVIARMCAYSQQPLLEFSSNEKSDIDVRALFQN